MQPDTKHVQLDPGQILRQLFISIQLEMLASLILLLSLPFRSGGRKRGQREIGLGHLSN